MIRHRSVVAACVAGLAAALGAARLAAQPPAPAPTPASASAPAAAAAPPSPALPPDLTPPPPVFRAGVDSVTVDAIVTDKQGRPVTDLTADDFEIRESGKPQTIQTFKLIRTDAGTDDPLAQNDIMSFDDQARETAREDNRLFVIFLDDYHVEASASLAVRQHLAAFVQQLTPHDLVAIATPWGTVTGLTFTRDHDQVAGQIMSFIGREYNYTPRNTIEAQYAGLPPADQEQFRNNMVISALSRLCMYLGTLRDGRKTVLYVSEGLNGNLPGGVPFVGDAGPGFTAPNLSPNANAERVFENSAIDDLLHSVFEDAAQANTSIYTLDPRGLASSAYGTESNVSIQESMTALSDQTDVLRVMADNTDGRYIGQNDFAAGLKQMVQDSSTYYLLGYTSSLAPRDGKFHPIQVRVKRKDVQVRARKGYWAYSAEEIARASEAAKPGPSADVVEALDALGTATNPDQRKPITVWMGAMRGENEKARVTIAWEADPPPDLDPSPREASTEDAVDHVNVTATSIQGVDVFNGPAPRSTDPIRTAGDVQFDAPAGSLHVRVVAMDAHGTRLDTDDLDFDVPDFTSPAPTITTPEIFAGRTAHDLQVVRASAAPVPAAGRSFSHTSQLLLRFGAYGPAGTTPAIAMRVLNQSGAVIATLPPPKTLAGGLEESQFGLDNFPPGNYLIEIAATTNGESAKKLVAIHVTG